MTLSVCIRHTGGNIIINRSMRFLFTIMGALFLSLLKEHIRLTKGKHIYNLLVNFHFGAIS